MDIPKIVTEITPENGVPQEQPAQGGIEATSVAEAVPTSSSQPSSDDDTVSNDTSNIADPVFTDFAQNDASIAPAEVVDLTSSDILPADDNWVDKVKEVIKEDKGQPYKEEKDAEILNEEYMKSRFNIDVDAPVEEKN